MQDDALARASEQGRAKSKFRVWFIYRKVPFGEAPLIVNKNWIGL